MGRGAPETTGCTRRGRALSTSSSARTCRPPRSRGSPAARPVTTPRSPVFARVSTTWATPTRGSSHTTRTRVTPAPSPRPRPSWAGDLQPGDHPRHHGAGPARRRQCRLDLLRTAVALRLRATVVDRGAPQLHRHARPTGYVRPTQATTSTCTATRRSGSRWRRGGRRPAQVTGARRCGLADPDAGTGQRLTARAAQ